MGDSGNKSIDLRTSRIAALLNKSSGQCDAGCEDRLRAAMRDAGIAPETVVSVESRQIEAALQSIVRSKPDVLIVLGGDGTIRTAAETCGKAKIALMPLPGGTMNMLPKAIYGERNWVDALTDTLAAPAIRAISGGEVGDHRFFCAGIFGSPALWAAAREAVREKRLAEVVRRALAAFRKRFSRKIRYEFGPSASGSAEAVAVLCPLISKSLPSAADVLEAAALDLDSSLAAFRLAFNALFADWRSDEGVSTASTPLVRLSSRGGIPAILDGEIVKLPRTAQIRFVARCFDAVVPRA